MKKLSILCAVVVFALLIIAFGCAAPAATPTPVATSTPVAEPAIPAHFSTYTKQGIFSISYPPEWEPVLSVIPELEQITKEFIESVESGLPLERVSVIFFAGVPSEIGYEPNVNLLIEYIPEVSSQDEAVEAEIRGLRRVVQDYHEFSRVTTTIDGREATIIDCEATYTEMGKAHQLFMMTLVDKYVWVVTCTSSTDEFSRYEDDFYHMVKSLRILSNSE